MKKLLLLSLAILMILCCLASCDWFKNGEGHEHTWEYVQYETGHFKQYTCGCPSPDIMGEHYDADEDCYCDVCGFFVGDEIEWQCSDTHHWWLPEGNETVPGIVYGYGEHINADADLFCDVCRYDMSNCPTPTNYFLRNQAGCEWINEVTVEDILEIKMFSDGGGPLPPVYQIEISTSTDKTVIADIFEQYYWLDMAPRDGIPVICDGSTFYVQFTLNNGAIKTLSFLIGEYFTDANGNCFEIVNLPKFSEGSEYTTYSQFVAMEGWNKCEVWCDTPIMEPYFVCDIPLAELKFNVYADNMGVGVSEYEYFIETDFGRLGFITNDVFFVVGSGGPYYQFVGKNLDELIDDYFVELNYSLLIEAFWEKIPEADYVKVDRYYGEFESGAIAAMMSCSEYDYTEALWDEIIDDVVIHYSNGNRIIVLYEGEFYNLTTAYENGYITKDDLQDICDLQNQFLGWIEEE